MHYFLFFLIICSFSATSCAKNPVTGKQELHFVTSEKEVAIGLENYPSMQQVEGGRLTGFSELSQYVQKVGHKLSAVSDRPEMPYEFVILDNSIPNAWALPGGKIAINRGLLVELESEAELAAVLSHEIVHVAARHGAKVLERGILLQSGLIGLGSLLNDKRHKDIAMNASALGLALITNKYGRNAELEADSFGMEYMAKAGYDPYGAVALQEKFLALLKGGRSNVFSQLFASHPPTEERLEKNKLKVDQLGVRGITGQQVFTAKIYPLKQLKPAYELIDKSYIALEEKRSYISESKALKALEINPSLAKAHAILGIAKQASMHPKEAIPHYTKAIELNPNYYDFYLKRGICLNLLKNPEGMERDLIQSISLFDTPKARFYLGKYALEKGQIHRAKEHLNLASNSETNEGKQAYLLLTKIDLPQNPQKYIGLSPNLSSNGYLQVLVENKSPVTVKDVEISIWETSSSGRINKPETLHILESIKPGGRHLLKTEFGTYKSVSRLEGSVNVKVITLNVSD